MIRDGAKRAIARRNDIPPYQIPGPYTLALVAGPGKQASNPATGEDFRDLVYEVLCRGYDYELQRLPVWPMEPGRRRPVLSRGQRRNQAAAADSKAS